MTDSSQDNHATPPEAVGHEPPASATPDSAASTVLGSSHDTSAGEMDDASSRPLPPASTARRGYVPRATNLPEQWTRRRGLVLTCAVAVGTWIVFWPALHNDFVAFDDGAYVTENREVQRGLTLDNILWAFSPQTLVGSNWHPLTVLSHMLDCQLFGLDPFWHHGTSVLLHGINTALLCWFFASATGSVWGSAWIAAMFAVHPLHVESVAWIAERKDVLSTLFWFLALLAYLAYARRPSVGRMTLVAVLLTLGLLCKPMLVTLPLVLLLLDFWPLGRIGFRAGESKFAAEHQTATDPATPANERRRSCWMEFIAAIRPLVLEKLPLLAIVALFCVITIVSQQSDAIRSLDQLSFPLRVVNAFASYVVYLWQTVYPIALAAFYPHPANAADWTHLMVGAVGMVVVAGGSWLAIRQRERRPYLAVGWFWYLVTLVPVIGIVQVGGQAHADRYTYVPLIGVFLVIAWMGISLGHDRPALRLVVAAAALLLLLICVPLTRAQIGTWRDSGTLFSHAVAVTERNFLAHRGLGNWYLVQGDLNQARDHYQRVLDLRPDNEQSYFDLAYVYHVKQDFQEAMRLYRLGLEKYNEKMARGERSLSEMGGVYANVGQLLALGENKQSAIEYYRRAIEADPLLEPAYLGLGALLSQQGDVAGAIETYQLGLERLPSSVALLDRLARIRATATLGRYRDADKALELARRAVQLSGGRDPRRLDTLAAALAEAGDFDAALSVIQQALRLAEASGSTETSFGSDYIQRLRYYAGRYQSRKPLREGSTLVP